MRVPDCIEGLAAAKKIIGPDFSERHKKREREKALAFKKFSRQMSDEEVARRRELLKQQAADLKVKRA